MNTTPISASAQEEAERRWPPRDNVDVYAPGYQLQRESRRAFVAGAEWERTQVAALLAAVGALLDAEDSATASGATDRVEYAFRALESPAPGDEHEEEAQ